MSYFTIYPRQDRGGHRIQIYYDKYQYGAQSRCSTTIYSRYIYIYSYVVVYITLK